MREYGCRRMVAFHRRIERSRTFSQHFNQAVELLPSKERPDGTVSAAHVDGDQMPRSTRNRRIAEFSQNNDVFRLLSNVRILSEGINFPRIDAVTMIDTKRNPASVIQIIGRAVRPAPGKEVGTIVLPVLIGEGEGPIEALARSEHRPIMELLAALRAADPDLERSIDELRLEVDPDTGRPPAKRRFILNIPVEVGPEFADAVNVMLVDALAPKQPAKQDAHEKVPPVHSQTIAFEPEPTADLARDYTLNGLEALRYAAGKDGIWGHVPERVMWVGHPFEIGQWWKRTMRRWNKLGEYERSAIAEAITWLAVEEIRSPGVRGEMRRSSKLSLAVHLNAWVCDFDSSAPETLQLLAEGGHIGTGRHLDTKALCAAFEGPGFDAEQSARIVCKALLIAGDECRRRAMPGYFAKGFTEALTELRPYHGPAGKPAAVLERAATGQHAAGWQTAEPFFPEARHARKSKPTASRPHIRRKRTRRPHKAPVGFR